MCEDGMHGTNAGGAHYAPSRTQLRRPLRPSQEGKLNDEGRCLEWLVELDMNPIFLVVLLTGRFP